MSELSGSGISVEVPAGWEGRIYAKHERGPRPTGTLEQSPNAVLHVASFPLPPGTGDYGGGAVEQMTNTDLLVILLEHGRQSAGSPLFAAAGVPRITIDDVSTTCLQRLIDGQGGAQKFFRVDERAFCLYVVFGSYLRRGRTIPVVNDILRSVSIS
jgi:hypothetical protein